MKAKFFIFSAAAALLLLSCSHPLKSAVVEGYSDKAPLEVRLLPLAFSDDALEAVEGDGGSESKVNKVRLVLDEVVRAKLSHMGYKVSPSDSEAGLNGDVAELALTITKWKGRQGALHTYLKISIEGKLSSADSETLWQGSYNIKESAVSLDKSSRNLSVIEAFEPILERAVEALFLKFPKPPLIKARGEAATEVGEDEELFDWLR
ncbi:MAG: hypothetical protein KAS88_05105 [Deltaproteobacteria bacterium]|nr:hypothetical protein [Deltaproteobacteria bacterium]